MSIKTSPVEPITQREPVLSVRDLRVWYGSERGPIRAVDGVSFEVRPGETVGLVGESGCGKSTLSRALLGLTGPGSAMDGEVVFGGRNLVGLPPRTLRKLRGPELGLILQGASRLNPLMKISEHFKETLKTHTRRLSRQQVRERAVAALHGMGISPSRYKDYPHQFSDGMRQRIMIALALVLRPAVLVADEPAAALDALVEAQIIKVFTDLRKNVATSLVLTTQHLGIVAETCDRVAVMYAGRIVEQGDVREVFGNPQHPYTKELLGSTPSPSTTLHDLPGSPLDPGHPPQGCRFHPRCPAAMRGCAQAEPPEAVLPSGVRSLCWLQAIETRPSLADELGTAGREPLAAVKEISVADQA